MMKAISNWGLYPVSNSNEYTFQSVNELSDYLKTSPSMIARGMGRCYGDASLSNSIVSTLKYNKFIAFDKKTGLITCQSGVTLEEVLEVGVPSGWFLPVTPGTKFVSVGGAVASDVHGKNHHTEGSFSNHITKITLMTGKGEIVTCGPDENTDLFDATCGGMGLTGVILKVEFQLKKIESSFISQTKIKAKDLNEILELFDEYNSNTYSVAWIDCLKRGKSFGRSVLILGEHAKEEELSEKLKKKKLEIPRKTPLSMPFYPPSFVLNSFTIKIFNALIYNLTRKKIIKSIVPYEGFFYPLDSIRHWNRMYGSKGFVQYQFVVPFENGKKGTH